MPTLDEYMAMLTPQQPDTRARVLQALGQLGVGLLSAPNWQKGLARGGLLAYDAQQQSADRAAQDQIAKLRTMQMAQDMADKDASRAQGQEDAKQLGAIFSGAPNLPAMGPGGPTPANAAAVKPPSQVEQYRKAAAFMAARGNVEGAKKLSEIADKIEGEFSTSPQIGIGPDGKPVFAQFSNKGGFRPADGFAPPPDIQMLPLGDRTVAVDKRTVAPGAEFAQGQSPESRASNALGWANYGLSKDRFAFDQAKDKREQDKLDANGKPLTESQANAAMYLGMMRSASDDLAKLDGKGLTTRGLALARGDVPYLPKALQTAMAGADQQKYQQAAMQWTEAMLRATTGATAPPEEVKRASEMFFPQLGEEPDVIAQKNARRADMERMMAIKAGATGAGQVGAALGGGKVIDFNSLPK